MNMKKLLPITALLLALLLTTTACKQPEPTDAGPTATPSPVPTATFSVPTPEPTVTPMDMGPSVERPGPDATPIRIDPIDRPEIQFEPYRAESTKLGVSLEVPSAWVVAEDVENKFVCRESVSASGEPFFSFVEITVTTYSTAQTAADAEAKIDSILDELRAQYGDVRTSAKDKNTIMGAEGRYVTYHLYMPADAGAEGQTVYTRGRLLVVPVDKKLYSIRYLCPADYNSDYINVFYKVRSTMKQL